MGIDGFLQDWRGECNWANPPWSQLPSLTGFLAARPDAEAVVLAPDFVVTFLVWNLRPIGILKCHSILLFIAAVGGNLGLD